MPIDIYSPEFLLGVMQEKKPVFTFMRDRYFEKGDVFKTEKVLLDFKDEDGQVMAPFVIPDAGPAPMLREGYETGELTPPYISISLPLTVHDLNKRMAGEDIVSTLTPEQRQRMYVVEDLDKLDKAITRREEWMCAQTMLDNKCVCKHIGNNGDKGKNLTIQYYTESKNPCEFTPEAAWDIGADEYTHGNWYEDIRKQLSAMRAAGRQCTEIVVGANVADLILRDKWAIKMMDIRRAIGIAEVNPKWTENGVTALGRINFGGHSLDILCYEGTYEERNPKTLEKTTREYFPKDAVLLTTPKSGKLAYGAVTQMEDDKQFHTRTGTRVPKKTADVQHNASEFMLTSRPVAMPKVRNAWRSCRNVFPTK